MSPLLGSILLVLVTFLLLKPTLAIFLWFYRQRLEIEIRRNKLYHVANKVIEILEKEDINRTKPVQK